jgi:hypothetical protein
VIEVDLTAQEKDLLAKSVAAVKETCDEVDKLLGAAVG